MQSPLFLRQLTTSAEIEEIWGLPCGALDLELDAVEDAAREMHSTLRTKWLARCTLSSTSDRWRACQHRIRSRRLAVTDKRWTLSHFIDTIRARMNENNGSLSCQVVWLTVSFFFQFRGGGVASLTLALRVLLLSQRALHWGTPRRPPPLSTSKTQQKQPPKREGCQTIECILSFLICVILCRRLGSRNDLSSVMVAERAQ